MEEKTGLEFYKIIINEGYKYLNNGGYICLEIGYDQKEEVLDLINRSKKYCDIRCLKDLGGNDRVIILRKCEDYTVTNFVGACLDKPKGRLRPTPTKIHTSKKYLKRTLKKVVRNMTFSSEVKEEILNLKMWDSKSNMKQEEQIKRLHIRELFLKSGFVNNPKKNYHLEIVFSDEEKAKKVENLLLEFTIPSKVIAKGKGYMLYIKDGEEISNFLALIGAMSSVLKFEEIRVERDIKNNINRAVNCETANLNKTIDASVKQIEAIEKLKKLKKFEGMPDNLKEIANIRMNNPHASLVELGKMLQDPIGKSGVNHRLRKILEIAED